MGQVRGSHAAPRLVVVPWWGRQRRKEERIVRSWPTEDTCLPKTERPYYELPKVLHLPSGHGVGP